MAETYDMESLARAAKSGDADAQYRLAALLVQSEEEGERGLDWLRKAAATGHANARYTLALMTYKGHLVDAKPARAVSLLESISGQLHPPARQLLASIYACGYEGKAADWDAALDVTIDAVGLGDPGAMKDVGMILAVLGENDTAHDWLWAAATRGDLMAAGTLVARYGDGDDRVPAATARTWAEGLARAGHPLAPVWARAIDTEPAKDAPPEGSVPTASPDLREKLATAAAGPFAIQSLLDRPRVEHVSAFVSRPVAAHLIALARPHLQAPSEETGGTHRALLTAAEMDLSAVLVSARMAAAAKGTPLPGPLLMNVAPPGAAGPLTAGQMHGDARVTALLSLSDMTDQSALTFGGGGDLFRAIPGTLIMLSHRLDDGAGDPEAHITAVPGQSAVTWQLMRVVD